MDAMKSETTAAQSSALEEGQTSDSNDDSLAGQIVAGYRPRLLVQVVSMFALLVGGMLFGLDTTIAATVQASILETFGISEIEKLPWIGIGFPMASVSTILLIGQLFSFFEIKWLLVAFFATFEVGSAVCGAAPTMNALIVGRVITGLGGAGMYIGALTYINVFTTPKERPLCQALCGIFWGVGAIIGPVVGGAFAVNPHATWRWAFYINLPIAAIQSPVFLFYLPRYHPRPGTKFLDGLRRIDWVGTFLTAAMMVFLLVTLTFSGSSWPWASAKSIVFWVLFGLATVVFVLQQSFAIFTSPQDRLFPIRYLKSRTLIVLFLATAASGAAAGVAIYWIPLLFQFTRGDSAIKAAVRLLLYIIPYIVSMMVSGGLLPVIGWYAPIYTLGGALIIAGSAAMYVVTRTTSTAQIYGFEVLLGVGAGISYQIGYAVSGVYVGSEAELAPAISFINISQIGGITLGLAIAGCMFQNIGFAKLSAALAEYHLPDSFLRAALSGAQTDLTAVPEMTRNTVVDAVVRTTGDIFGLIIAAGALMLVCSIFLKWERMSFAPVERH